MSHLTVEQIEQALMSPGQLPTHLDDCTACRQRVHEAEALRQRVKGAYATLQADDELRGDVLFAIRSASAGGERTAARKIDARPRIYQWAGIAAPRMAAAAAVAIAVMLIIVHFNTPQTAIAASAELSQIHQANIMPHVSLHGSSDPDTVAAYFREKLGFTPALPQLGAGMQLRGCCVAHFRNRPVGSYVLDTDNGVVSVIVLREDVDTLKLGETVESHGRSYHRGSFARNTLVAAQTNGYTYCVVGEADAAWMADILDNLLQNKPR